jgi:hypothetical protein
MIAVRCGNCQTIFEAEDSRGGDIQVCPNCGIENQIPADPDEAPSDSIQTPDEIELALPPVPMPPGEISAAPVPARGLPGFIWWTIALMAIGIFIGSLYLLFSDNWEQKHVEFLALTAQRADALMEEGDYDSAAREYHLVLETVGDRNIQSIYLKGLIERARVAEQTARTRFRIAATAPALVALDSSTTQPAADSQTPGNPTPASSSTGSDLNFDAVRTFQRASEAFTGYLSSHPLLIQDDQHRWRQREFLAWDISYQLAQQSEPAEISLKFTVNSRTTDPHDSQPLAAGDMNFLHDDFVAAVPVQSRFVLHQGRWLLADQQINQDPSSASVKGGAVRAFDAAILDDLVKLEAQAFNADLAPHFKK